MTLEYNLDKSGFGKLSEDVQKLYKSDGDNYQLNVKGAVSKSKVDEFRDNNIQKDKDYAALEKKYSGVDLDKYAEFQATQQKIDDKKLIDAGDIDALVAGKVSVVESDYKAKLDHANQTIDDLTANNSSIVSKYEIQGATSKAFSEFKIRPEMQAALTSQINSKFTVKEGKVVAMEGNNIVTGKDGNLSINEFVSTQPDIMKIPSSGGNGNGGGGGVGQSDRSSADKIKSGLVKARG